MPSLKELWELEERAAPPPWVADDGGVIVADARAALG